MRVALLVALGGCQVVFPRQDPPLPPHCFPPDIPPSADPMVTDSDGDGVVDALDNCPSISNDQHDEDNDCRGDACDLCPHVTIDPDVADRDGDSLGANCDPDDNAPTSFYFDPFRFGVKQVNDWVARSCQWGSGDDVVEQTMAGPVDCFFELQAGPAAAGTLHTAVAIDPMTVASVRPFSAGLAFGLDSCASGCYGTQVTISRDATGVWLRAVNVVANNEQPVLAQQLLVDDALDGEPIGLAVRFSADGSGTATATIHNLDTPELGFSGQVHVPTDKVGLTSHATTASFEHIFFAR